MQEDVIEVFDALEIDTDELTNSSLLRDELGMDSQEIAEMLYLIQRKLNVKIPNLTSMLGELKTVGQIARLMDQLCVQKEITK